MTDSGAPAIVPRNFRLLDEWEKATSTSSDPTVSLGLENPDDHLMNNWVATILGPHNSVHENRLYTLKLVCDKDYPNKPPTVRFKSRINMTCVNQSSGAVDTKAFPVLGNWRREYTMQHVLVELRREMGAPHNRKLSQPPEGSEFF